MTPIRRRHLIPSLIVIAAAAGGLCGCAAPRPGMEPLTPEQQQLNVESFDYVWTMIRDQHWDQSLGGLDWEAVRDELRPQVAGAQTMNDARRLMHDAMRRLGQSHFGIIPAEVYEDVRRSVEKDSEDAANDENTSPDDESNRADAGIELRVLDGEAVVTRVEPGAPAEVAGVQRGWKIASINDDEIDPLIERVSEALADQPAARLRLVRTVASRLTGEPGETVQVTFLDGDDKPQRRDIELAAPRGHRSQFGHMPAQYVWTEWRVLDGNVGYFALNTFFDLARVMAEFGKAITAFRDTRGVVIDLRGNPGGIGGMAMGMAGWLVQGKNHKLGTMMTRGTDLDFVVNPRSGAYKGPIAILIDECSASTTEIFAGGMKDLGRARIFGARSAGAALPSIIERLPNGDGFQYAFANYVSESGAVLEGVGVAPDEEVIPTRAALLNGQDPALDAAVAWILVQ